LVGMRRAQELVLTNRRLSAQEAFEWNLITKVVESESLLTEARAMAEQLAAGPTEAFASARRLLLAATGDNLETQMEYEAREICANAMGHDGAEGINAFANKRSPEYTGKR
jgi:2-(1,2-epoxy-1,2-dihydrophenyl)acetyl-CoA isomerase